MVGPSPKSIKVFGVIKSNSKWAKKYKPYSPEAMKLFFYWINERQKIWIRRNIDKEPKPWTKDKILQQYKFTNAFRILDKGTIWALQNIIEPYEDKHKGKLIFNLCMYRQINLPETMEDIGYVNDWQPKKVLSVLQDRIDRGKKVYSAAYVITGTFGGPKTLQTVYKMVGPVWPKRQELYKAVKRQSLEHFFNLLNTLPGWGKFLSYEVTCDLTYSSYFLMDAKDRYTWANAGPGAKRGLRRIFEGVTTKDELPLMKFLLNIHENYMEQEVINSVYPNMLDMRMIEHSLCEWDKYMRCKLREGRPKCKYPGV